MQNIKTELLSRVTLVDETGRVYERLGVAVELQVQDEGRTLKVFVAGKRRETEGPVVNGERFAPGYTAEAAEYEQRTREAT